MNDIIRGKQKPKSMVSTLISLIFFMISGHVAIADPIDVCEHADVLPNRNTLLIWQELIPDIAATRSSSMMNNSPCDCAFRWEEGGHWDVDAMGNPIGTITEMGNIPSPRGIVRCGNAADTESGLTPCIDPGNNTNERNCTASCTYDPSAFNIDISGIPCFSPNNPGGGPVALSPPSSSCPVIWLQFDVRAFAGTYQFQIVSGSQEIGWALYATNNFTADGTGGDCNDLSLLDCGIEFNNTWSTFTPPNVAHVTNHYLVIWGRGVNACDYIDLNFKARNGCGDAFCYLQEGSRSVDCQSGGSYTVKTKFIAVNDTYSVIDSTGSALNIVTDPSPLTFGTPGDSGSVCVTYPAGVDFNFSIANLNNPSEDSCILVLSGVDPGCPVMCMDPPTILCPRDTLVNCSSLFQPTQLGMASGLDCDDLSIDASFTDSVILGNCSSNYIIQRTWLVMDANGSSSCVQTITVQDTMGAALSCPSDITINCGSSTDPSSTGSAMSSDNCDTIPGVTYSDSVVLGSCAQEIIIERTWRAEDACGNISTCMQMITVQDTTRPSLTCPSDTIVDCGSNTDPSNTGSASSTDNCDVSLGVTFSDNVVLGSCAQESILERTWRAEDACGNVSTCVQMITVQDTTKPNIFCPKDTSVLCTSSIMPSDLGTAIATDNCDVDVTDISYADQVIMGMCTHEMEIRRTWTAVDSCGNANSCVQVIMVLDTTAPQLMCIGDTIVNCSSSIDPAQLGTPNAMGNCIMVEMNITHSDVIVPGSCPQEFIIQRTWTASDSCNNMSTCLQVIEVQDSTQPVLVLPKDTSLDCQLDYTMLNVTGFANAIDNCDANPTIDWSDDIDGLTLCAGTGQVLRTFTVEDACGNISTGLQTITLIDTLAPQLIAPSGITVPCDQDLTLISFMGEVVNVECASLDTTYSDDLTQVRCGGNGLVVRTWIVQDQCGNSSSINQEIRLSNLACFNCTDTLVVPPGDTCLPDHIFELDEVERWEFCGDSIYTAITYVSDDCVGVHIINGSTPMLDTTCIVLCDSIGGVEFCDTTIFVVILPPNPDTVFRLRMNNDPDTICFDNVLEWGPGNDRVNECNSFTHLTAEVKEVNTDTCVVYENPSDFRGVDTMTLKHCYDTLGFEICDTTTIIVVTVPPPDTILGRLGPMDTMIFCFDTVLQYGAAYTQMIMCQPPAHVDDMLLGRRGRDTCLQVMTSDTFAGVDTVCLIHCYPTPIQNVYDTTMIFIVVTPTPDTIFVPLDSAFCIENPIYGLPKVERTEICGTGNEVTLNMLNDSCFILETSDPSFTGPDTVCIIMCDTIGGIEFCDTTTVISQSCPINLACNDHINFSLNENCSGSISSDQILEGELGHFATVRILDQDGLERPNVFNSNDIGQTFTVIVEIDLCQLTCWGTATIEDKIIPNLECRDTVLELDCGMGYEPEITGLPLPPGSSAIRVPGQNEFIVSGFDLCGDVWLRYSDAVVNNGCGTPYYKTITRKWSAEDQYGNTTECEERIGVLPGNIGNIQFPSNYDGINNFFLECDDKDVLRRGPSGGIGSPSVNIGWNTLDNGYPSPYDLVLNSRDTLIGTGFPTGGNCEHLVISYRDRIIETCGPNTYKLFRTWRAFDWCTGEDSTHLQMIKVIDTRGPQVICPPSTAVEIVSVTPWTCTATYLVPEPIFDPSGAAAGSIPVITRECSNWTYEVKHKVADEAGENPGDCSNIPSADAFFTNNVRQLANGRFEIFDMPYGCNWIEYIITDDCGNKTICRLDVFVEDTEDPVAVCDEHTAVSLNENGEAKLCADVVDNGSQDNCSPREDLTFAIKKMGESDARFRNCIDLTCDDVAISPVMIVFRVFDAHGNYNDCMVEAIVQDKIAPEINCPDEITLQCTEDYFDDVLTGLPTTMDQCGNPTLRSEIIRESLNDCGIGFVIKRWRVEDAGGRFAICDQRINIVDSDLFDGRDIIWPRDVTIDGCTPNEAHPDQLPFDSGRPRFRNNDCAKPVAGFEDEVMFNQNGFCILIKRTWEVIDWCQYDVVNSTGPKWTMTQEIEIENNQPPIIEDRSCAVDNICANSDCEGQLVFDLVASDDCTLTRDLEWNYVLRDQATNSIIENGAGNTFDQFLPVGRYQFTWTVKDGCGNTDQCVSVVRVEDCKEPTPYCKPGIITTIMPSTGYVEVWASDFNDGSFDNCTDTADLTYSFSGDLNDTRRRIYCDDIEGGEVDTFEYEMWVTDLDGNQDFCVVTIIVQDNQDRCPNSGNTTVAVGGLIKTVDDEEMSDVNVDLMHLGVKEVDMMTDNSGNFMFDQLTRMDPYLVNPHKNVDHLNGVSTADLVMIQRHLLGLNPFDDVYQYIAADANDSKFVSAADISEISKLILGVNSEFPKNTSWRFVDDSQIFADPTNPWQDPLREQILFDPLVKDEMGTNFVGVKIGDINMSSTSNGVDGNITRANDDFILSIEDQERMRGESFTILFHSGREWRLNGLQFTLEIGSGVEISSITSGILEVSPSNYHFNSQTNSLTFSWAQAMPTSLDSSDVLFEILAVATSDIILSQELNVVGDNLAAEAYKIDLSPHEVRLRFNTDETIQNEFLLHQNIPNPFNGSTLIPFELEIDAASLLTIFDATGRILLSAHIEGRKGYNTFEVSSDQLNSTGVLYYQLESNNETATRRMMKL